MKLAMTWATAAALFAVPLAQAGSLSGTAEVLDGARLRVGGQVVSLTGIAAPLPGDACMVRARRMDCGILARAGLMDITAGATVDCRKAGAAGHVCTADGFDLSFGQIHAGWAVAVPGAPAAYLQKMAEARARKRGLWAARGLDGSGPYALSVKR